MKSRNRRGGAFSKRTHLKRPTTRKKKGKAMYGRRKAKSISTDGVLVDENDDNQSEYQESVADQLEETVHDAMRKLLKAECAMYIRKVGKDCKCALCPFRSFTRPCRLQEHLEKYHTEEYNWCASGKKQLRACCALYDNDNMEADDDAVFAPSPNYLRRSANIIRADIILGEPGAEYCFASTNLIDRDIRLVQYADGPSFRTLNYVRDAGCSYRKRGFGYFSEGFYKAASKIALCNEGRIEQVQEQMAGLCTNELASLQPKFLLVWEDILCDIFFSPEMETRLFKYLEKARRGGEFETLTVDSTVKPTFPLVGQIGQNTKMSRKKLQAVPFQDQLHAIHVVRGSSGSVLLINPMFSESLQAAAVLYTDRFSMEQRSAVRFFVADKVGPLLRETTKTVFPKIRCCALDPLHLAFATEQSTWKINKTNELHWNIRRILAKFNPSKRGHACSGDFYQGEPIVATKRERIARGRILHPPTSNKKAISELKK